MSAWEPALEQLRSLGFEIGVLSLQELSPNGRFSHDFLQSQKVYNDWIAAGYHGTMSYLAQNRAVRGEVFGVFPAAKSILVCAIPYFAATATAQNQLGSLVARYAHFRDYHRTIKRLISRTLAEVGITPTSCAYRITVDSAPVAERTLAVLAGLGHIGSNGLLQCPGLGSFVLLACIFIEDVLVFNENDQTKTKRGDPCINCNRCIESCPTGALLAPRTIDARKCLSYLTIEQKGVVSTLSVMHFKETLFGCDACQLACPQNRAALDGKTLTGKGFSQADDLQIMKLTLSELGLLTPQTFETQFAGTPFMRAKYSGLLRNLLYHLFASNSTIFNEVAEHIRTLNEPTLTEVCTQLRALQ